MFGGAKRISLTVLLILVLAQGCAQLAPSPTQQASSPSPAGDANEESASRTDDPGPHVATAAPNRPDSNWPTTTVAEREFPTAEVVIEDRTKPWKLWLISSPTRGRAQALEFFSGERVADVQVESKKPTYPGDVMAYSFTDRNGYRYISIDATSSIVEDDHPLTYGGWGDRDGRGHEVVLGGVLLEPGSVVNAPVDVSHLLDGQPICEKAAYIAQTLWSLGLDTQPRWWKDTEPGFKPVTKIIADYDSQRNCWITRPAHAVNLDDNTILIVVGGKAVQLNSKDLSPVGVLRDIRIVDVSELEQGGRP